ECAKDIISEVFWTKWTEESDEAPQVWMNDQDYPFRENRENLSKDFFIKLKENFERLKTPGQYEVGGLGACTLISRKALASGLSFSKIKNLSYKGEDMHFCIRASVLGFDLFADTFFPPFHIYRKSDLTRL